MQSSLRSTIFVLCFSLHLAAACHQPEVGASLDPPEETIPLTRKEPVVDLRKPPPEIVEAEIAEPAAPEHPQKRSLGTFNMTYYWVTTEPLDSRGTQFIKDKNCKRIAKVSKGFKRRLALEGSGVLKDGRLVSTAGQCKCGAPCFWVPAKTHKWGAGVRQRPLSPFRSIAVDPKEIRIGSSLYVAELDGLTMPGAGDEGGFVHDGCVVADDRGGGVRGKQIDFFAARKRHYLSFFKRNKLKQVNVYPGGRRCEARAKAHAERIAAKSGLI
ncbi:MAG: hypothetical protein JKY56_00820 [Kofleriaceae bacterium]|nr:hypothetical protein [Kofleriaceae bacterium]